MQGEREHERLKSVDSRVYYASGTKVFALCINLRKERAKAAAAAARESD